MEKNQHYNTEYKPYIEEDEIDLRELFAVLKRRKWIVFIAAGLVFVAALIYAFTSTPWYEAKATIEIGYNTVSTNSRPTKVYFDDTESLKHYIDVRYDTAGKFRKKGIKSYLKEVEVPRKAQGFITLKTYGLSSGLAVDELKKVLNDVMSKENVLYNNVKSTISKELLLKKEQYKSVENRLNDLIRQLNNVEKTINLKNKVLEGLKKGSKAFYKQTKIYMLLSLQENIIQNEIFSLVIKEESIKNEINRIKTVTLPSINYSIISLQSRLEPPYLVMTRVVGGIKTHDYPLKPKKKLILVVALVTGLILGVFLAFFVEYIKSPAGEI
ncbi:Wzz/FepE/Etk N-terminal domain-containing protein [Hippea maritima]|uniref:Lipopolysaccharide biosynthesis protein n=1 Tax=Hippea maritima (strain ATCC 700847 / DSM 10411 / MH2) TaxID=760142 RepID=F2LXX4_HIPMA|nr:Wzz/FepE/Etk N-terminal domain-containing protein [Hippea maritima]AEA33239.1 lipopolysaccharide biosynthesis protein [Hippea maritima DSM 10411]